MSKLFIWAILGITLGFGYGLAEDVSGQKIAGFALMSGSVFAAASMMFKCPAE